MADQNAINELVSFDYSSASPSQLLEWQKKLASNPEVEKAVVDAWRINSQGEGNLANVYRLQYYDAYKNAKDILGRDLTKEDYGKIYPMFIANPDRGAAIQYLSTLAEQEGKMPGKMTEKAPQYASQVGSIFQSTLGRAPTADELDYFGRQLATGEVGNYELGNFLKGTTEYQEAQDKAFRTSIGQELIPQQEEVFNKAKAGITADYQRRGIANSPALDFALTNLMGELEKGRQSYLTGLRASQYQGNKQAAMADYGSQLQNYLNTISGNRAQNQNMLNALNQRSWDAWDYNKQQGDYARMMNEMNAANKWKPTTFDWMNMGLNVLGTGAKAYTAFKGGA